MGPGDCMPRTIRDTTRDPTPDPPTGCKDGIGIAAKIVIWCRTIMPGTESRCSLSETAESDPTGAHEHEVDAQGSCRTPV